MLYAWQGQAPRFEGEADWSGFVAPSADLIGPVWLGQGASGWFGAVIRADNHPIEVGRTAMCRKTPCYTPMPGFR